MGQIPTAEDYIKKNLTDFWQGGKAQYSGEDVAKAMVEFAKLHAEAALKEAEKSIKIGLSHKAKDSILNSYPLDKIK